jgi:hypothetical protein
MSRSPLYSAGHVQLLIRVLLHRSPCASRQQVPCSASRVVPGAHQVVGPGTHRGSGPREVHTTTAPAPAPPRRPLPYSNRWRSIGKVADAPLTPPPIYPARCSALRLFLPRFLPRGYAFAFGKTIFFPLQNLLYTRGNSLFASPICNSLLDSVLEKLWLLSRKLLFGSKKANHAYLGRLWVPHH